MEKRIEIDIPESIHTYKQLSKHLRKKFGIDVGTDEDYEGYLFYNPDLRSMMGFVEEFGGGSVILNIDMKSAPDYVKRKLSKVI